MQGNLNRSCVLKNQFLIIKCKFPLEKNEASLWHHISVPETDQKPLRIKKLKKKERNKKIKQVKSPSHSGGARSPPTPPRLVAIICRKMTSVMKNLSHKSWSSHLFSSSNSAEQPVKIPFKKFIVQFCSNPSQQVQLWNFHLNWFMFRGLEEKQAVNHLFFLFFLKGSSGPP